MPAAGAGDPPVQRRAVVGEGDSVERAQQSATVEAQKESPVVGAGVGPAQVGESAGVGLAPELVLRAKQDRVAGPEICEVPRRAVEEVFAARAGVRGEVDGGYPELPLD